MKRKILSTSIILLLFISCFGINAYGASVTASAAGGSCKVGETVSASITYSGSDFGSATVVVNYDSAYLEFVSSSGTTFSSGNSFLVEATGSTSMSATFTFKAKKAGSTTITFQTPDGSTWTSEELFSCSNAYASITITSPTPAPSGGSSDSSGSSSSGSSSSSSSSSSTSGRGDFEDENEGLPDATDEEKDKKEEEKKRPDSFVVTIGDKKYTIVEDLRKKDAPFGFTLGKAKYDEWEVPAFINEEKGLTLLSLEDQETKERTLFIYDEATKAFKSETTISLEEYLKYLESAQPEETNWTPIIIGLIALCGASGGGLYYYFKIFKPKKEAK